MAGARAALALVLVAAAGCAFGNPEWRRHSKYQDLLVEFEAGDAKCSPPAPYTSVRACLSHDSAYELAREVRSGCREVPDRDLPHYTSGQIRAVRDYELAADMLRDGEPEWKARLYLDAVRLGGWWSWYLGREDCEASSR